MEKEKNQTQIRAEIGWLWQRDDDFSSQSDTGAVRYNVFKKDISENRLEGVWSKVGQELADGESMSIVLDYLTRKTVGGTLDIGFLDVRALLVVNHGPGTLIVKPGASSAWEGPWGSSVSQQNIVPPDGTILISAGSDPWKVTIIANTLTLEADDDKCLYDVAVVGKIGDVPSGNSSSSNSSSSSETPESISNE
ncbi:MAG: hypothetical protein IKW80_09945 [Thermoguttaceae bacterium]|nr:hypothetical protein [Thermoguttaceae bacterium]